MSCWKKAQGEILLITFILLNLKPKLYFRCFPKISLQIICIFSQIWTSREIGLMANLTFHIIPPQWAKIIASSRSHWPLMSESHNEPFFLWVIHTFFAGSHSNIYICTFEKRLMFGNISKENKGIRWYGFLFIHRAPFHRSRYQHIFVSSSHYHLH